jgi:hypothetical protein
MTLATLQARRAFPAIRPGRNKAPHVDSIVVMGESDACQLETSRRSPRDGQLDQPSCANLTHRDHRGALRLCSSLGANGLDAYLVPRVSTHMQIDQGVQLHKVLIMNALSLLSPRPQERFVLLTLDVETSVLHACIHRSLEAVITSL